MTTTPLRPIRVLLVDDHTMVRRGLATFLSSSDDLELVGEAATGPAAIELCGQVRPDVVLMDVIMPGMDGATTTRLIRERYPEVQVMALTSYLEDALVDSVLRAGAVGYLLKGVSAEELAHAIREAHVGRLTLAPEAAKALVRSVTQPPPLGRDLTEREREVLALMVAGLNNTQIAARLTVQSSTIKSHVGNILSKLGVGSRTEAVALAVRHRLVA